MQHVRVTRTGAGLATVELLGDGRLNLMSYAMLEALWRTANELQAEREIRAVVISGNGPHFSAGMNIKQEQVAHFERYSVEERLAIHAIGARACAAWEALDAITVCAIEGYCLGGGLAFSIVADFRLSSESAIFGAPELENGMTMSWQSVPRLVSMVGAARTRRLVMLAEKITALEAKSWALVDQLCEPGRALEESVTLAQRLLSTSAAPMRMTKHAINAANKVLNHALSYMDLEQYVVCQDTDGHRQALSRFAGGG